MHCKMLPPPVIVVILALIGFINANDGDMVSNLTSRIMSLDSSSVKQIFGSSGGLTGLTRPVAIHESSCYESKYIYCDPYKPFRMITGVCNNLNNPYQGSISTPFRREIDVNPNFDAKENFVYFEDATTAATPTPTPQPTTKTTSRFRPYDPCAYPYEDEQPWYHRRVQDILCPVIRSSNDSRLLLSSYNPVPSCPPRSIDLPGPRLVSIKFHTDLNAPSYQITSMLMQFGQFLDHDITLTAEYDVEGCCQTPNHEDCFPIKVSPNDPFYGPKGITCLDFTRSMELCENRAKLPNAITTYIDASNVYGSDEETNHQLRAFEHGKMLLEANGLLPRIDGIETAGDTRAIEIPGLTSMHTLWVREHNRVAKMIYYLRPYWSDELIYQHTKRIATAEYQNIIYAEYLPIVLGSANMDGLDLPVYGSYYSPYADASITTEFATAAYRFGHSLVNRKVQKFALDNSGLVEEFLLENSFLNPTEYRKDNGLAMEQILFGLVNQPAQSFDKEMTDALTNHLLQEPGHNFGQDLAARNIQRGRDHGIPGFCCYYRIYVDPSFDCRSGWDKPYSGISYWNWFKLKSIYKEPNDIDLFTGGLAQSPYNGGLTGEVFSKMKAKQFKLLKAGDRFFFTHTGQKGSFTQNARAQIKTRTLSSILCDNINIKKVPVNAFKLSSANQFVDCAQTPKLTNINELLIISP